MTSSRPARRPGLEPEALVVALLTAVFALTGVAFALLVPMFGNFDEQTHVDRARYTARQPFDDVGPDLRRTYGSWEALAAVDAARADPPEDPAAYRGTYLPFGDYPQGNEQQHRDCPGVCQNIQYGHPPIWYLLTAPVTAVVEHRPFPWSVLALRVVDVALVTPIVALTWLTAREVWPAHRHRRRRLGAAALVALMAPLAYTASGVNNDALLLLTAGMATWLATRTLCRGATLRRAALLGLVVSIGLLTKVQMVLMAPAFGLAVLVAPAPDRRERLRVAATFGGAALPGALWWLAVVLDDNPLAREGSELLSAPVPGPWSDEPYVTYALDKLPILLRRFWGLFDSPITEMPAVLTTLLTLLAAAVVVGWLAFRSWERPSPRQLRWLVLAAVPAGLAAGVLQASVSAYRRNGELRALAPRYLYPALPVLAVGAVAAVALIAGRNGWRPPKPALPAVLVAGAVGVAVTVHRGASSAYDTGSWGEILDRARAVSPVGRPAIALGLVLLAWLAALVAAVRVLLRDDGGA